MLVQVGENRSAKIDLRLAVLLAGIAGAINAAGFHAVGFFSANMTGNISSLSDHLALEAWGVAGTLIAVLAAFIAGSTGASLLIHVGRDREVRGIYACVILLEAVLLATLGGADLLLPMIHRGPSLVIGLSFLMGLQNATTTLLSNARVRTTHVSGMATDVGIEVAALLLKPAGDGVRNLLILHGSTLFAFLVGGTVGVLLYLVIGSSLLLLISLGLAAIALPYLPSAR